jgi:hypothetical protein
LFLVLDSDDTLSSSPTASNKTCYIIIQHRLCILRFILPRSDLVTNLNLIECQSIHTFPHIKADIFTHNTHVVVTYRLHNGRCPVIGTAVLILANKILLHNSTIVNAVILANVIPEY